MNLLPESLPVLERRPIPLGATLTKPMGAGWAMLVMFLVRGLALWVVVPVFALTWLLALPLFLSKEIPLGALLGWGDPNLIALIQRVLLRPWMYHLIEWTPPSRMADVTHRVRWFDPA